MNKQNLMQAINECNNGQLPFNLGNNRSFLFNKKWYPLRATINRARAINHEGELTTDRALLALCTILDYIKIGEVDFTTYIPIEINQSEIINEVKLISDLLKGLSQ
jgi:hypothetical protein